MNPIDKLRASAARVGWTDTVLYAIGRALARLSFGRVRLYKYHFVAQPVPEVAMLPAGRGRNITFRWLEAEEAAYPGPRPHEVVAERLRSGAICLVAETRGVFSAFLWLQLKAYRDDEVACRYQPVPSAESAWDFDVYVEPAMRLGFVFAKLWDEANAYLRTRGIRNTFSRISAFNVESLAAHARLGTTRVGTAVFLEAGAAQLMLGTVAPRIHVSWKGRSAPTLFLSADHASSSPGASAAVSVAGTRGVPTTVREKH